MRVYIITKEVNGYEPYPEIDSVHKTKEGAYKKVVEHTKQYELEVEMFKQYMRLRNDRKETLREEAKELKPIGRRNRHVERGLEKFAKNYNIISEPYEYIYNIEEWEVY